MSTIYDAIIFTGEGKYVQIFAKNLLANIAYQKYQNLIRVVKVIQQNFVITDSVITDTRLMQTFFWSWLIIWLKRTQLVRTFVYSMPVFQSQHYRHAGYNRLIEIMTMASVVT